MSIAALLTVIIYGMVSLFGIAAFLIGLLVKQRWHATLAAVIMATVAFVSTPDITNLPVDRFTSVIVGTVIAMMIAAHLSFTIKQIVKSKAEKAD